MTIAAASGLQHARNLRYHRSIGPVFQKCRNVTTFMSPGELHVA